MVTLIITHKVLVLSELVLPARMRQAGYREKQALTHQVLLGKEADVGYLEQKDL